MKSICKTIEQIPDSNPNIIVSELRQYGQSGLVDLLHEFSVSVLDLPRGSQDRP